VSEILSMTHRSPSKHILSDLVMITCDFENLCFLPPGQDICPLTNAQHKQYKETPSPQKNTSNFSFSGAI